ncbi:hypothetical protein VKT23_010027 [Stygiomarasmius scandens]|uniref:Uncharacterized protein n=1 Tax=Marasmiellus scandens TaxID=2682957 RepID=A0ABR1JDG9_9AGAR
MLGSTSPSCSLATSPFTSSSRSPNLKPTSPPKSLSPMVTTPPVPLIVQHAPVPRPVTSIHATADAKRESHAGSRPICRQVEGWAARVHPAFPVVQLPHSSSSAIFERDIEPLVSISPGPLIHPHHPSHSPSSPHQHQPSVATITPHSNPTSSSSVGSTHTHVSMVNPHRISRAQTTAAIEQSVPSVLDSAAELLTSLQDTSGPEGDRIEVEAPVPFGNPSPFFMSGNSFSSSGVTGLGGFSPIGRGCGNVRKFTPQRRWFYLGFKAHAKELYVYVNFANRHEFDLKFTEYSFTAVNDITETWVRPRASFGCYTYFCLLASESGNSRQTRRAATPDVENITMDFSQQMSAAESVATAATSIPESPVAPAAITTASSCASQHRQTSISSTAPGSASTKRFSFFSYTDLLSSTPTSTLPLSSLMDVKGYSGEEPPHLLLNSLDAINHSAGSSSAGGSPPYSPLISPLVLGAPGTGAGLGGASPSKSPAMGAGVSPGPGSRAPSMRSGNRDKDSLIMLEDLVSGEWEREGLGRGLEERLERMERMERMEAQQQQVGVLGVGRA